MTGQYAHNHGVLTNAPPLGGYPAFRDSETLATWLDPDYQTAWVGKYLNGYGGGGSASVVPPGWDVWRAPVRRVYDYQDSGYSIDGVVMDFPGRYQVDVTADFAVDFIDTAAPGSQPFFLVASLLAPHAGSPFEPDDPNVVHSTDTFPTPHVASRYRDVFANLPIAPNPAFNEADVSDKPFQAAPLAPWEVDALTEVNQQRRESLLSAEDALQRVVAALRANGELANTYVVFTSDNGYLIGEHRIRRGKLTPYEPAVRVPLIVRGPGIPAGSMTRQLVGTPDIAPTVLGMTGLTGAEGSFVIDGVDLLPMVSDPNLRATRPIVIEGGPLPGETDYQFRGIRTPRWKYVERSSGRIELYDLATDPNELDNLEFSPAHANTRAWLSARLKRYADCSGAACR